MFLAVRRWAAKTRNEPNPYTCRLLRRMEFAGLWVLGKRPYWSNCGHLCVNGAEHRTVFPAAVYRAAARWQNKCPSTRLILSL